MHITTHYFTTKRQAVIKFSPFSIVVNLIRWKYKQQSTCKQRRSASSAGMYTPSCTVLEELLIHGFTTK
jgi:hypothetical protein